MTHNHSLSGRYALNAEHVHARSLQKLHLFDWHFRLGLHFACTCSSMYSVQRRAQRSRINVFFLFQYRLTLAVMTNFEFCRDSIHSKTTESCLLLFSCSLDMYKRGFLRKYINAHCHKNSLKTSGLKPHSTKSPSRLGTQSFNAKSFSKNLYLRWFGTVLGRTKCANFFVKTYCLWYKQLENEIILGGHRAPFSRKWGRTLLFSTFLSME